MMMITRLSPLKWTDCIESTGIFRMNGKFSLITFVQIQVLFFLTLSGAVSAINAQPADSLKKARQDTLMKSTTLLPDSLMKKDSVIAKNDTVKTPDTTNASIQKSTPEKLLADLKTPALSDSDTTINLNGTFFGVRAGWTIGNFELVKQWQEALPDSLSNFNLTKESFIIKDSTHTFPYTDTTELRYVIKERPGEYNISIPIGLQFMRISEQRKTSVLISFAWIGKTQKSVITGLIDSLSESVNIHSNLNTFSFSLEGNYSFPFLEQYFKIDGVDNSYFTLGFSLSSILVRIGNDIDYSGKSDRLNSIKSIVKSSMPDKKSMGAVIGLRAGVSTVKALSKQNLLEFGVSYMLSRYDYFYKNDNRLNREWIQPGVKNSEKPLAFFSNRIEFSVGVFKRVSK